MKQEKVKELLRKTKVVVVSDEPKVFAVVKSAFGDDLEPKLVNLEDAEAEKMLSRADLIVTTYQDESKLLKFGAPVFLMLDIEFEGYAPIGYGDVMSKSVHPFIFRRRAENLIVRFALEEKFLHLQSKKVFTPKHATPKSLAKEFCSSAVKSGLLAALENLAEPLDECEPINAQDEDGEQSQMASSRNEYVKTGSATEMPESEVDDDCERDEEVLNEKLSRENRMDTVDVESAAEDDPDLDDEEAKVILDSDSDNTDEDTLDEITFLRKKSVMLQYQLSMHRTDSERTMNIMRQFHNEITKVSDLLQDYEKLDTQEGVPLYSAIKEIWNIVDKQRFAISDLKLDGNTKRWLDATFLSGEEEGIALDQDSMFVGEGSLEIMSPTPADAFEEFNGGSSPRDGTSSARITRPGSQASFRGEKSPSSPVLLKHRQSLHAKNQDSNTARSFRRIRSSLSSLERARDCELSKDELTEEIFCQDLVNTLQHEEEWDVWRMTELQMMAAANEMLHAFGMVDVFKVKQTAFRNFFSMVSKLYKKSNPYHNLFHGFDVMKTCYFFLEIAEFGNDAPNLSGYALLIAGLCHDVAHPGTNNKFHVAAGTELAVRYNDRSVLESYHSALTFRCIRKGNDEMFGNLDLHGRREMRKIIVESILATDVSKHVKLLKAVNDGILTDHLLQLKLILCCADVSNPIKPPAIATKWSAMVNEEFFQQGDEEKALGMEVSPFCDRDLNNSQQLGLNFIDFVVSPIMTALKQAYPTYKKRIEAVLDVLANRRENLRQEIEEGQQREQEETCESKGDSQDFVKNKLGSPKSPTELPPLRTSRISRPKFPSIKSRKSLSPSKSKQNCLSQRQEKQLQRVARVYGQDL